MSSDNPSPGGGTAAAAAGAMAASLLGMVCGVTAKNKKYETSKGRLNELNLALTKLRDELINLAAEDARAYDSVVEAIRGRRANPTVENEEAFQLALKRAAEVPLETAETCVRVLELTVEVAKVGTKSASSDILVAWELAEAGFTGASANVIINLKLIEDERFTKSAEGNLRADDDRIATLHSSFRKTLKSIEPAFGAPKNRGILGH